MNFEKLADIFEEKARVTHAWATEQHEYNLANILSEIAKEIRTEVSKSESAS